PTAESLGAQAVLVVLAIVALLWTFVLEPRRVRGRTTVMVPEPRPPVAGTPEPLAPPARVPADAVTGAAVVELLRSLERMEADLAEMRAEVERMRRHLCADRTVPVERPPR